MVNAVAGAYAESSAVVVISGAPGVREQREDPLIHHRFGPFAFQKEIFQRITCAAEILDDPLIAFRQIDRALHLARIHSKPAYIELPRDMVDVVGHPVPMENTAVPHSDHAALQEAVNETLQLLGHAHAPALLVGVELHRADLQDVVMQLVNRAGIPVASTLTGKSVVGERHSAYLGVYEGAMGAETTKRVVEGADCLLILGVSFTDVDLGIYTAQLDPDRMVRASGDEVFIRHHRYKHVYLKDFVLALQQSITPLAIPLPGASSVPAAPGFPHHGTAMTVARMIGRLNEGLTSDMMVVCDVGDCLFAALELRVHERTEFLASAYYTSMGFATPAALGAHMARPDRRALILVGDGAFQMTGTELSTIARHGLNSIIIVFNNAGYSTERFILEGPFNNIATWHFDRLGEVFGPLQGFDVHTEEQFEAAFQQALTTSNRPSILNVHLDPGDPSPAMRRLAAHLGAKVAG